MSKVTKKEQIENFIITCAAQWRQINKLKLYVGQLTDVDWINDNVSKLKELDQSVFDGRDEKWRFAAVDSDTEARLHSNRPYGTDELLHQSHGEELSLGRGYDKTNWQNSLIEREPKELTGSDLLQLILTKSKYQPCYVSKFSEKDASKSKIAVLLSAYNLSEKMFVDVDGEFYEYIVPINNQGEPLTAADVGL